MHAQANSTDKKAYILTIAFLITEPACAGHNPFQSPCTQTV